MQTKPTPGEETGERTIAVQDIHDQGVVLGHVVTNHPAHFRLLELVQELSTDSADFSERDWIERAVRELIGVGLLFRCEDLCEDLVLPTRAALRFNEILDGEVP